MERKLVCKNCGKEFVQVGRGRDREYCYSPECENIRKVGKRILPMKDEEENLDEVIYEKQLIIDEGYSDLIQAARELGALRFRLVEEIKKINDEVAKSNQIEQDLLHKLEFSDEITVEDAQNFTIALKQNRESRRQYKNKQFLIGSFLNEIPLKAPEKFVRKGIEMVKNQKYEPRELQEIFDESEVIE